MKMTNEISTYKLIKTNTNSLHILPTTLLLLGVHFLGYLSHLPFSHCPLFLVTLVLYFNLLTSPNHIIQDQDQVFHMEELGNGNTITDEERSEIKTKVTPYEIAKEGNDYLEVENEKNPEENDDDNEEIHVTNYLEPIAPDSYVGEQSNDNRTEVVVENEKEQNLQKTNEALGVPSDIRADRSIVPEESDSMLENPTRAEDNRNIHTELENRQINQTPVSANPRLAQRTSWGGCCGLFQFLRRSAN